MTHLKFHKRSHTHKNTHAFKCFICVSFILFDCFSFFILFLHSFPFEIMSKNLKRLNVCLIDVHITKTKIIYTFLKYKYQLMYHQKMILHRAQPHHIWMRCKVEHRIQKSILPVERKKILHETIHIHSHGFIFCYQFIYSFVLIFFSKRKKRSSALVSGSFISIAQFGRLEF